MNLTLHLKSGYFDLIKNGRKLEEYRAVNDYWKKRIEGKQFNNIILLRGYPKAGDPERALVRKWNGYSIKRIKTDIYDGDLVYAIDVSKGMEGV